MLATDVKGDKLHVGVNDLFVGDLPRLVAAPSNLTSRLFS